MSLKAISVFVFSGLLMAFAVALNDDELEPGECEQLCNVELTDPVDPPAGSGIVPTYVWLTTNGTCECGDPSQGCISLCEHRTDCKGDIRFSMLIPAGWGMGNPAGAWGPLGAGFAWCGSGQYNNLRTHETLSGCGDDISIQFQWYQDTDPNTGTPCDTFVSTDTFAFGCGTCDGLCPCEE